MVELVFDTGRFRDLQRAIDGISQRMLNATGSVRASQ
ncbi:hypothetical protein GU243_20425 [Pseudarthrobacter psychrotolerans]|uniref:Uncharacterized protein n=1 Tax=Pseudarthrobacter psychrotolerans TaxID=2697569 RepID=A0A6P1NVN5_9MICC|nr:hypothetical protein [Pseudarthrobacter psychrotolerans]QHK22450.1 hypothetical protein GU243_20425 [Pseudarthrobacter psychrotolerans]RAX44855.1 hypothetical protein DQ354_13130 [Arthrobacter sp. AQ5-06]